MDKEIQSPTNATQLVGQEKEDIRAKFVIMDALKDHLIPHLTENKTTREM